MNDNIFNAFTEFVTTSNKVYELKGELNRLYELSGVLSEKIKAYREVEDYDGANAISVILIDDIQPEVEDLNEDFKVVVKLVEQKAKRFKGVCAYYGINILLGENDNIIKFRKGEF